LLYPSVTHAIFEIFQCRELESSDWLKSDMSISCDSDEYAFYHSVAILLAGLFTFGIPCALAVFFWVTLRTNTKIYNGHLKSQEKDEELSFAVDELTAPDATTYNYEQLVGGFKGIVQDYKPQYFYFELVDFLRKFTFTAGLLFANQGSMFQLVTGSVFAMIFLFQHCSTWPFNKSVHNVLKAVELCCVFLTFQVSIMLKMSKLSASVAGGYISESVDRGGYDIVLVVSLLFFIGLFVTSTLWSLWKTFLVSRDIDFSKELEERSSASPTTAGLREKYAKFAPKADLVKSKQFAANKLVANMEKERIAAQLRKAAADKRNAIAKERQAEREAKSGRNRQDRNSIEMTDTSSKMPDECGV